MTPLTVLLMNYRRPANLLDRILPALRAQTVKPQVFLWDNAEKPLDPKGVEWVIHSAPNQGCWPRWWMAQGAQTEYVCTLDDDLCPTDPAALQRLLERAKATHGVITGLLGVKLEPGKGYRSSPGVAYPKDDTPVHIVKGRCMLLQAARVKGLEPPRDWYADDIYVSAMCRTCADRPSHRVAGGMSGLFADLPSPHAVCSRPGHYESRDRLVGKLWPDVRTDLFPGAQV